MSDLLLDRSTWDLMADAYGNIATCAEPYAIAQAVANEVKLFLGEGWYDTTQGVPHFTDVLGVVPHMGLIRQRIEEAARNVPEVTQALAQIGLNRETRTLTGVILVTTTNGEQLNVSL
ncbi:hypothetical protein [Entomobacter blattae]|uniref:Uncharacterized protein n=1 Tax=Entomobacter blattae TaxID=2762277 RepID=A0A7H1NU36_9PROT|nr:hypothetical protein [Entomobacter blattae]QNT79296.1 hypothetical protein JGUZn3_20930 [Entomobacter blattae]